MYQNVPILGTFEVPGRPTAAGGTAFTALIPPWMGGPGRQRAGFRLTSPPAAGRGVAHVEKVIYTTGATAHLLAFMRPLNYTTVAAAVAANATAITLTADPGLYSTNYKYDSTGTAVIADNAIAASDYVVYQLADGTWQVDTIASGTFGGGNLVLTTGTPNVTGGGILAGALIYWYGVVTDKDPATGLLPPQTTIAASQTRDASWASTMFGVVSALHPGDPLLFYSPNTTNAGVLEACYGFHGLF